MMHRDDRIDPDQTIEPVKTVKEIFDEQLAEISRLRALLKDQQEDFLLARTEIEGLETERNAMAEYLRGMPCPYRCNGKHKILIEGLAPRKGWRDCPHEAKLRELNITDTEGG